MFVFRLHVYKKYCRSIFARSHLHVLFLCNLLQTSGTYLVLWYLNAEIKSTNHAKKQVDVMDERMSAVTINDYWARLIFRIENK